MKKSAIITGVSVILLATSVAIAENSPSAASSPAPHLPAPGSIEALYLSPPSTQVAANNQAQSVTIPGYTGGSTSSTSTKPVNNSSLGPVLNTQPSAGETLPHQAVEGTNAGGEKQMTIVDQNGNLKMIENNQSKTNSGLPPTVPVRPNPVGMPGNMPASSQSMPNATPLPVTPTSPVGAPGAMMQPMQTQPMSTTPPMTAPANPPRQPGSLPATPNGASSMMQGTPSPTASPQSTPPQPISSQNFQQQLTQQQNTQGGPQVAPIPSTPPITPTP